MDMTRLPAICSTELGKHLDPSLFRALGDPKRIALIAQLAVGERSMNVSEASACCGVHVSGTSRHLSILKSAGVVFAERRGREVRYRLATGKLVSLLRGLADALEACCRVTDDDADEEHDHE